MGYPQIISELDKTKTVLLAVSKTKSVEQIMELYNQGQRLFGENKVQELLDKKTKLPSDIEWHMIGHLQTNKVKTILAHVDLIHGVDSYKLIKEINKEAKKINITSSILLQMFIATEESKFGLDYDEISSIINDYNNDSFPNVKIKGLMGMASFTDDLAQIRKEFLTLLSCYDTMKSKIANPEDFTIKSMGMSGDYQIAIECGSNLVRIGSLLFGSR